MVEEFQPSKPAPPSDPEAAFPNTPPPPGENPKAMGIRLGTCRQRDELRPKKQYWHASAQAWSGDIGALPKDETQ